MTTNTAAVSSWRKSMRARGALVVLFGAFAAISFYSAASRDGTSAAYTGLLKSRKAPPLKIFMYELPPALSHDVAVANYTLQWVSHPSEYESDVWVYNMLKNSPLRTMNPDEATLFYIPMFPTRVMHLSLATKSWQGSVSSSWEHIERALEEVNAFGPYWQRYNGFDHFAVITGDAGRCIHFSTASQPKALDMAFLMHHGDQHQYDFKKKEWPCYRPERDILLPAYVSEQELPNVPALRPEGRKPNVLYRFSHGTQTATHRYHNVLVRQELRKQHDLHPVPGADWKVRSLEETVVDMSESSLCVTPPGVSHHTSRFYRALRTGCIPITFRRGYDLPFQKWVDYDSFTINIQPGALTDLGWRTAEVLNNPKKLKAMQTALDKAQSTFLWSVQSPPIGVHAMLLKALQDKAEQVRLVKRYKDLQQ